MRGQRRGTWPELTQDRPLLHDGPVQVSVLSRVDDIGSASKDRNGGAAGAQGTAMGRTVAPSRHPAHDRHAGLRQIVPQPLRYREPIRRCPTRADNSDSATGERHRVAAHPEHDGWIDNPAQ
jgi:hypothetical protein